MIFGSLKCNFNNNAQNLRKMQMKNGRQFCLPPYQCLICLIFDIYNLDLHNTQITINITKLFFQYHRYPATHVPTYCYPVKCQLCKITTPNS